MSSQAMKRQEGTLNAYYSVKGTTLRGLPTVGFQLQGEGKTTGTVKGSVAAGASGRERE